MPPLLGALLLAKLASEEPVQRQAWLAPLLAGLYLRAAAAQKRISRASPLASASCGRNRSGGATLARRPAAGIWRSSTPPRGRALAQHDRLILAKALLARKGRGRRHSSALPRLAALLLDSPLVSVPMIAETLRSARRRHKFWSATSAPSLREITGRKRYRAWTIG